MTQNMQRPINILPIVGAALVLMLLLLLTSITLTGGSQAKPFSKSETITTEPDPMNTTPDDGDPAQPPPNFPEGGKQLVWRLVQGEGWRQLIGLDKEGRVVAFMRYARVSIQGLFDKAPNGVSQFVWEEKVWVDVSLRNTGIGGNLWRWGENLFWQSNPGAQRIIVDLSGNGWATRQVPGILNSVGGTYVYSNPQVGIWVYQLSTVPPP